MTMIPSGAIIVILAVLVAGVMSFASGIFYLCKGKKLRGALLMAAPVLFFGYVFIHEKLHPTIMDM